MRVVGWVKSSTVDYPGQLCTSVFTPGCNFNCRWCHNRNVWDSRDEISSDEVLAFLHARQGLLDGVAISGGEPTLQLDLPAFCEQVKQQGFLVKLDTNGSNPQALRELLSRSLVDYVAMDYKAPWQRYSELCGCEVDVRCVQQSMQMVFESGLAYELRTTVVPQLSLDDLLCMAGDEHIPLLQRYALQLYRPCDGSPNAERDAQWLERAAARLQEVQPNTIVRA